MSREMSLDEIGLLTRRPLPVFSKVLALVIHKNYQKITEKTTFHAEQHKHFIMVFQFK